MFETSEKKLEFFRLISIPYSLEPMKKRIQSSILFLFVICLVLFQTNLIGQKNLTESDPDVLEKEANELEIKAGKAQDPITRKRMILEVQKNEKRLRSLEINFTNKNFLKHPKEPSLKLRFYSIKRVGFQNP